MPSRDVWASVDKPCAVFSAPMRFPNEARTTAERASALYISRICARNSPQGRTTPAHCGGNCGKNRATRAPARWSRRGLHAIVTVSPQQRGSGSRATWTTTSKRLHATYADSAHALSTAGGVAARASADGIERRGWSVPGALVQRIRRWSHGLSARPRLHGTGARTTGGDVRSVAQGCQRERH